MFSIVEPFAMLPIVNTDEHSLLWTRPGVSGLVSTLGLFQLMVHCYFCKSQVTYNIYCSFSTWKFQRFWETFFFEVSITYWKGANNIHFFYYLYSPVAFVQSTVSENVHIEYDSGFHRSFFFTISESTVYISFQFTIFLYISAAWMCGEKAHFVTI